MVQVEAGVQNGHPGAGPAQALPPGLGRVDSVMTPLEVEEEVVVPRGGWIAELHHRLLIERVNPLQRGVEGDAPHPLRASDLAGEVRVVGGGDDDADRGDCSGDRPPAASTAAVSPEWSWFPLASTI